jgi:hypothetical protein
MSTKTNIEYQKLPRALRNLRHLYEQMLNGQVKDCVSAAKGLLGPAIVLIEQSADEAIDEIERRM